MQSYDFSVAVFSSDVVNITGKAFNEAWLVLCSKGVVTDENRMAMKEALAKRIIELDTFGDYDHQTLCYTAIASLAGVTLNCDTP